MISFIHFLLSLCFGFLITSWLSLAPQLLQLRLQVRVSFCQLLGKLPNHFSLNDPLTPLFLANIFNNCGQLVHGYFVFHDAVHFLDEHLLGRIGPMDLFVHFHFLSWAHFVAVFFCLLPHYHRHGIINQADHLIFARLLHLVHIFGWEKPFAHGFGHLGFHLLSLLFFLRFGAGENVTGLVLAEAIRNNCAVRFWLVLFFFLLLHHFLVYAVRNQLWILITAVIVPDVLFLWVGLDEIHLYLLYREIG